MAAIVQSWSLPACSWLPTLPRPLRLPRPATEHPLPARLRCGGPLPPRRNANLASSTTSFHSTDPLSPDTARIATLRSLNPAQALFAARRLRLKFREPDSTGNPDEPASYDAQRVGAIPTSWLLTQVGSTLSAPITSDLRPRRSRSPTPASSASTTWSSSTTRSASSPPSASASLTVQRGYAGSTAAPRQRYAHRRGGLGLALLHQRRSDRQLPAGRATGAFATPGTGTERARDWLARSTAGLYHAADWDGVMIDVCIGYMSCSRAPAPTLPLDRRPLQRQCRGRLHGLRQMGAQRFPAFQTSLRNHLGLTRAILVNDAPPDYSGTNGIPLEGFPTKHHDLGHLVPERSSARQDLRPVIPRLERQRTGSPTTRCSDVWAADRLPAHALRPDLGADGRRLLLLQDRRPAQLQLRRYDEYDNAGAGGATSAARRRDASQRSRR